MPNITLNPIPWGGGNEILFQCQKSFQAEHFRLKSCYLFFLDPSLSYWLQPSLSFASILFLMVILTAYIMILSPAYGLGFADLRYKWPWPAITSWVEYGHTRIPSKSFPLGPARPFSIGTHKLSHKPYNLSKYINSINKIKLKSSWTSKFQIHQTRPDTTWTASTWTVRTWPVLTWPVLTWPILTWPFPS